MHSIYLYSYTYYDSCLYYGKNIKYLHNNILKYCKLRPYSCYTLIDSFNARHS